MTDSITWTSNGSQGIKGKGQITLATKALDTTSTSLALIGDGFVNYGPFQQQNFLHLLENFASNTAPSNPTIGQLWFSTADTLLYVCVDPAAAGGHTVVHQGGGYGWVSVNVTVAGSDISNALGYTPYNGSTNPSGYLSSITATEINSALGYTPYSASNPNGFITFQGAPVQSVAGKSGNVSLTYGDIGGSIASATLVSWLGYTPYNATNPSGYITGISSGNVTTALGYTPYNSSNPNGYISGISSAQITSALGYTPYNSSNPNGYISSTTAVTSASIAAALGYTPYNASNPNGYLSGITAAEVFAAISNQSNTDWYRTTGNVGWYNDTYATGIYATSAQLVQTYNSSNFQVNGDMYATGNVSAYSDESLKTNWRDLPNDFVEQLSGVKTGIYDRTDIEVTQVGVSAQSLQTILPEAVVENPDGLLSVAYGNAALAACVMLAKEIQDLKARIAVLEAK